MDATQLSDGFGDRLRSERKRLGLSQIELGDKVGLKQWSISQYEKGNKLPLMKTVYAFERVGMSLPFLVFNVSFSLNPNDYKPHTFKAVDAAMVRLEEMFHEDGGLSGEAKTRARMIFLQRFSELKEDEPEPSLSSLIKSILVHI